MLLPPRSSQVSCNLLESLPDGIGQLMFLEHLDVSGNALVRLPSLSGLKAITRLDCAGNRLKSLPVTLSGCATLRELCCNNNPSLEWLPTDLGLFQPELRGVWCNGCALLELPNSLEAATGLVHLDVGRNRLRRLPDSARRRPAAESSDGAMRGERHHGVARGSRRRGVAPGAGRVAQRAGRG